MSSMGGPPMLARGSGSPNEDGEGRGYDVVVSYNRAEGRAVERIARRIQDEGLRVFFDRWSTTAGRLWQEEISGAIQTAAACAVFIGRDGLGDWARLELAVAQSRVAKDPHFRLFMVLLAGAPSPLDPRLAFLSTRAWVDLRPDGGDGSAFDRLMVAITGVPRHPEAPRSTHDAPCPYRGLEAFDEQHAALFFGREDDTRRLCERLSAARFVAVLGPSGSGKSSIVKAGLIPALREDALAHSAGWTIRSMTPGAGPLTGLAAQVSHVASGESMQRTLDGLAADRRTLDQAIASALADRPTKDRVVLVVDQLEELFTLCRDENERAAFLGNLTYAATIPGGRTIVVVTLRADFYYRCAPYAALRNALALQHVLIGPLGDEGLRRAIEEPAWAAGLTLEPGLVDTIVADVGDRPGTLPLLQHVLLQVWQRRRGRLLTVEAYRESGGVQGALAKHADAVYNELSESQRHVAERVLLRLVQPGEGTEDARRRVDIDELLTASDDPAGIEALVSTLADARLVTTSRDETSDGRLVEITHEALLQGWPRLRHWLDRDREALLAHRRLTEASGEWEASGRDDNLLYRGSRLAAWRASADHGAVRQRRRLTEPVEWQARSTLNRFEREFLDASEKREHRERAARRRRIQLAFATLTMTLAVITVVAAVAVHQRREAQRQRDIAVSGDLTARSVSSLSQGNIDVAALLGLEAYRAWPTVDARNAVLSVLPLLEHAQGALRGHTDEVNSVAFSPDGKRLATAGDDGTVRVWDPATHRPVGSPLLGHTDGVNSVAFSPDGATLASGQSNKDVVLWSVARRRAVATFKGHRGSVVDVAFSPDGATLASASVDGSVRLWDVIKRRAKGSPFRDHRGPIYALAFSPDGSTLAAAGKDGSIRLSDVQGHNVGRLLSRPSSEIHAVAFSPDGKTLASGDQGGAVRLWNIERRRTFPAPIARAATGKIDTVQFAPDGNTLAFAGAGQDVHLWDVARRRQLTAPLSGHTGEIYGLAFDPTGRTLASASADSTARLWDPRPRQPLAAALRGHDGGVFGLAFSPNGRILASGGADKTIRFWNVGERREIGKIATGQSGPVSNVAFSSDGKTLASAGDKIVRLWDVTTRRPRGVLAPHAGAVWDVAFSSDGRTLASAGSNGTVQLWDVRTHRAIGAPLRGHQGTVIDVAFAPDGLTLASAGWDDGTVRVWNLRTSGRGATILRDHIRGITNVAFSPNSKMLASTGTDGVVRLWNAAAPHSPSVPLAGKARTTLEGLAFSVDGRTLAAVGDDGNLRLWEVRTRRALTPIKAHARAAFRVAFGPNGKTLATAGDDVNDSVRLWVPIIWRDDEPAVVRWTCARVRRNLTQLEWKNLIPGKPYHQTCR
jgi:WD40 repeat protein